MRESEPRFGTMFILGVRVDNIDFETASKAVRGYVTRNGNGDPCQVFFTNAHTIHLARRDAEFRHVINRADAVLPDGSGLKFAGRVFRRPIIENLNGTDFVPHILEEAARERWSVYLLGGKPNITKMCRSNLQQNYPTLPIAGVHHGHFMPEEEEGITADINSRSPDILLVAMGSPLQEKWIARNAPRLKTRVCFAVGGLFDFLSGERKRAPRWMRRLGLEWIYRFVQDPRSKWQRIMIEIPLFVLIVLAKRVVPRSLQQLIARKRVMA